MFKQIFIALLFYFLLAQSSLAASLAWRPTEIMAAPGDMIEVSLWLEPEGEQINALEGELIYPAESLILQSVSDGGSIINFWLESPNTITPGVIRFSGIIPGGWSGILSPYDSKRAAGKVLTLILQAQSAGKHALSWRQTQALRNDGAATPAIIKSSALVFNIDPSLLNNTSLTRPTHDTIPPEDFGPIIARDENLFTNRWFITFATSDLGRGLAGYEIQEHTGPVPRSDFWRPAISPHVLLDQKRRKYVSVRALDLAGNERIVTLPPVNMRAEYPFSHLSLIIIILCIVTLFYYYYSARRRW